VTQKLHSVKYTDSATTQC